MNANEICCPGCGAVVHDLPQSIDLHAQHARYLPEDVKKQTELTKAAKIPGDGYALHECAECGLGFCEPFKAPSPEWYDIFYAARDLYPAARWEFPFVAKDLSSLCRVGEIGCGSGEFLKLCRDNGIPAFGTDFSEHAIRACRAAGLDAAVENVAAEVIVDAFQGECSDVVAFQLLEHLDDIASIFRRAAAWGTESTRLWVAVPSDRRPARFFGERDLLDEPPHHMTRWTELALQHAGKRHGWDLECVYYEPLSLRAAVWWWSTRSSLYKWVRTRSTNTFIEKAIRFLLLPLYAGRAFRTRQKLSGATMLAKYTKP